MKCPGQDTQYWKAGAIFESPCPKCGTVVEFFKDDTTRKCGRCGHRFLNPKMDFGCASYCQYAEQCIGDLPPELLAQKEDLLKDRVAIEMKRHFKTDFRKIGHATRVARHAEHIGREIGGNLAVIIPAAYLLHIEDADARQQPSNADTGPPATTGSAPVTRAILHRLGAREPLTEAVCEVVGAYLSNRGGADGTAEYLAVFDAESIGVLEDRIKNAAESADSLLAGVDEMLLTDAGRREARAVLQTHASPSR